jgi:hypothetical protein
MTYWDKNLHKFCQRMMTDFVRVTPLVLSIAVSLNGAKRNRPVPLHNERT